MIKNILPKKFLEEGRDLEVFSEEDIIDLYTRIKSKKNTFELAEVIAERDNVPVADVREGIKKLRALFRQLKRSTSTIEFETVDEGSLIEKARAELSSIIGKVKTNKKTGEERGFRAVDKYVLISDIHIPYHHKELLAEVMNLDAKYLIIAGDLFDMYQASRHTKDYQINPGSIKEELAMGAAMMEAFSNKFEKVYIIAGNHDTAPMKRVMEAYPQLLSLMIHPIEMITYGMDNVEFLKTEFPDTAPHGAFGENLKMNFFGMIGDVGIGHFDNFTGADAAKNLYKWLRDVGEHLPIEKPKLLIQGHVHRLESSWTPDGTLLTTSGCACKIMPYVIEKHGKFPLPVAGYMTFEMSKDKVNLDSVRQVYVGQAQLRLEEKLK